MNNLTVEEKAAYDIGYKNGIYGCYLPVQVPDDLKEHYESGNKEGFKKHSKNKQAKGDSNAL